MKSVMKRRGFLGAALVSLGAAGGWLSRRFLHTRAPSQNATVTEGNRFTYDVSEFQTTDPALLRYRPGRQIEVGFKRVKRLIAAPEDRFWVAGDRSAKLFTLDGQLEREIQLDRPPHCLRLLDGNRLLIGSGVHFAIYDEQGTRLLQSPHLGQNTFLTAVTALQDTLYLADAGNREIIVFDLKSGKALDRFGKRDPSRNNPGLSVPSPYLDLAITPDHQLKVANPGRLRIETYSLEGSYLGSWGEPGLRIDRFCGCCNPVFFCMTPSGGFITSEKGLARINIYNTQGKFQGAVAGPETLLTAGASVKQTGAGFDVALGSSGRVLALDPFRNAVRLFEPLQPISDIT